VSAEPKLDHVADVSPAWIQPTGDAVISVALAGLLVLLAAVTTGGFDESITVSSANTWAEIVLLLLGAGACAAMLVLGVRRRAWGAVAVGLFAALAALTALSIIWSVAPDDSWQATNLTLAYLAVFAGAASLARLIPGRWRVLVAAIALMTAALSAYALLMKVFPASLDAADTQGRLQGPLGYWNATGTLAALGLAPCLWAWSRREGGAVTRGLAVPAVAVLMSVIVLSYSRSSLIAAVVAVALWVAVVPRRISAAALLGMSAAGAAVISGWALARPALTGDLQPLALRTSAGHTFGVVVLVCLLALAAAGIAVARASERVSLSEPTRRRIGTALVVVVCLIPVAGVAGLAASSRGLTGEISHAWSSLTSVNSTVGNGASRIVALGSSRPLYWSEGITVGEHALFKGVGALGYATARTRYTSNLDVVEHAHSYVIQTFADLGLLGLAVSLALLVAWAVAAARAIAPGRRWGSLTAPLAAEREGLIALLVVVIAFGFQSAIDWTWYFIGVAVPALVAAGWLAGRGPLDSPGEVASDRPSLLARPGVAAGVTGLVTVSLLMAWLIWQPLRSSQAAASAETAAFEGHVSAAFSDAHDAAGYDPLSLQPLLLLSELYQHVGEDAVARSELVKAVRLQPENFTSWLALGSFDLAQHHPRLALPSLERAVALDPTSPATGPALASARAALG
jgi:hypothetical protein